jgi:hypothetical protein
MLLSLVRGWLGLISAAEGYLCIFCKSCFCFWMFSGTLMLWADRLT